MKKVTCTNMLGESKEVSLSELKFRPSVYGVIIKNEKVLMGPCWDGYDYPGGAIELGETLEEGFMREIFEETGLTVKIGELLQADSDFFLHPHTKETFHSFHMRYTCKSISGEITDEYFDKDEDIYLGKAEWLDLEDIQNIKFFNTVKDNLALIKKAHALYKNNSL